MANSVPALPNDPAAAERDGVFIREYVRTGDEIVACVRAGLRDTAYPISVTARRQLARPEIIAGIKAMQSLEKHMQPIEVSQASLTADMEDVFGRALEADKLSDAIAAKKLQAALNGYLDTKITVTHKKAAEDLTDEELERIVAGRKVVTVTDFSDITDGESDDNAGTSGGGDSKTAKGADVPS